MTPILTSAAAAGTVSTTAMAAEMAAAAKPHVTCFILLLPGRQSKAGRRRDWQHLNGKEAVLSIAALSPRCRRVRGTRISGRRETGRPVEASPPSVHGPEWPL